MEAKIKNVLKVILWNVFKIAVPFEKLIAMTKRIECLTTSAQFEDLKLKIKDGDVLFSKVDWEISNLGIVGIYTHVAVYMNGMVYEAVTSGVRKITLEEWFFKKDHVGLARCNMFQPTADQLATGTAFLESCIGESYDYDFAEYTRQSQYCSAYWYAYMESMFGSAFDEKFPKPLFLGLLPVLLPSSCWNMLDKVVQYN